MNIELVSNIAFYAIAVVSIVLCAADLAGAFNKKK